MTLIEALRSKKMYRIIGSGQQWHRFVSATPGVASFSHEEVMAEYELKPDPPLTVRFEPEEFLDWYEGYSMEMGSRPDADDMLQYLRKHTWVPENDR